jgi:hypothetical protein
MEIVVGFLDSWKRFEIIAWFMSATIWNNGWKASSSKYFAIN